MASREDAFQALADRIQSVLPAGWVSSRVFKEYDDPSQPQPAALVIGEQQTPVQDPGLPARWHLSANVLLYWRHQDPDITAGTLGNDLLDTIHAALRCQPGEGFNKQHTTLGGKVVRAWISGPCTFWTKTSVQCVGLIPVDLFVA